MNLTLPGGREKSRLLIVLETFLLLGFWASTSLHSVVPLLIAGVLFCVGALYWRSDAQREKYRTEWIVVLLGALVVAIPFVIHLD